MKPSERMKLQLQRQREQERNERPAEPIDDDDPAADRMGRLEREQMEARKQEAASRSGRRKKRVVLGDYRRDGRNVGQKRM